MTDAKSLVFLKAAKGQNTAIARVAIVLSAYPLEILHLPGVDNVLADTLSRQNIQSEDLDEFLSKSIKPMTEKETAAILDRMVIPEGRKFSVAEVRELLCGDHWPSPNQTRKPGSKRTTPFFVNKNALPELKPERVPKLPRLQRTHPFYPEQRKDLREQAKKVAAKKVADKKVAAKKVATQTIAALTRQGANSTGDVNQKPVGTPESSSDEEEEEERLFDSDDDDFAQVGLNQELPREFWDTWHEEEEEKSRFSEIATDEDVQYQTEAAMEVDDPLLSDRTYQTEEEDKLQPSASFQTEANESPEIRIARWRAEHTDWSASNEKEVS